RAGRRESRSREDDVVALPGAGLARRVHERWILAVHRRGLAVGVRRVVVAVEHLNLELAEQEDAAVAASLTVPLHLARRRELHVQLTVGELGLRAQHSLAGLEHPVLDRPG